MSVKELKEIYNYIAQDSKFYAKREVYKIRKKVNLLKSNPNIGKNVFETGSNYLNHFGKHIFSDNYKMQTIKQKWAAGQTFSNAWVTIPNAWTSELVAMSGYDVMTIDAQHGLASDLSVILAMLQGIEGSGTVPFVRLT